jgi:DtxR family Mn-dependent transcriptional regulator
MYLKTIAELAEIRTPVPVTRISEQLRISTVSASEMVHRLQDQGLLTHTPYKGALLTERGSRRAYSVIRRQRLWECFLFDELRIAWERVHELACNLEHGTDAEVTEALAGYLGHPTTCPHGNPIPSAEGVVPPQKGIPLSDLDAGASGEVLRIQHEEEFEVLCSYLAVRGIKPGLEIAVEEIAPLDGPISIRVGDASHVLGRRMASQIMIEVEPGG